MTFEEILDQAIAMLQRRGRVTYQTLRLQFQIGIGRSLTAPPSHTTWHTGPYQGGSVRLHVVVST
jgi:hypothetical protein